MDVSLISSADQVSDARIHRLCNVLVKQGLSVEVIALGKADDAPDGVKFTCAPGDRGFLARIIRDLVIPFQATGRTLIVIAPDLLPISSLVTKIFRKKLVADVHEDYMKLLEDRAWATGVKKFVAQIIAKVAVHIARNADLTSVADNQVPPCDAKDRLVVRNLPDLSLISVTSHPDPTPRAVYIGDVRRTRGIFTILELAERLPEWQFDIVGSISMHGSDREKLESWQSQSSASSRVTFHGKKNPRESWRIAQGAWVGLALLEPTPAFIEAVPSKVYEYMAAGLVVVSTSLPRSVAIIKESGNGYVADATSEIAATLRAMTTNPQELAMMRERGLEWITAHIETSVEYATFAQRVANLCSR